LTNTITQLHFPQSLADYFNTRISPLSPYQKYDLHGIPTAHGPDQGFRWCQWPAILIRWFAEATGNTGYNELRLLGRGLSALADSLSILLVFLTAQKLYNRRIALLTAALSSLAVLQIQQSHFMTVDNFAVLFSSAAMFSAAQIATTSNLTRTPTAPQSESIRPPEKYRTIRMVAIWYLALGVAYAMAVASRINLLPLGGIVLVAAFIGIADIKLKKKPVIANESWDESLPLPIQGIDQPICSGRYLCVSTRFAVSFREWPGSQCGSQGFPQGGLIEL
jgi:hypothetical protein